MRFLLALLGLVALIAIIGIYTGLLNIRQTETASLPEVKVEGGNLPEFNASVARVDVGTEKRSVDVPTVGTEEKTVEVPSIDIVRPADKE